jgi:hypothetical protein
MSASKRIDAVLPLIEADWEQARQLLFPTLIKFFEPLNTLWVIVPPGDVAAARRWMPDERFRVISETDLIPELDPALAKKFGRRTRCPSGWRLQQVLKLAASRIVSTPFYLCLDADVICARKIAYSDLVTRNRGRIVARPRRPKDRLAWYEWTERILGMPYSNWVVAVTPVLLNADAVDELLTYLEDRYGAVPEISLIRRGPFTEYLTYFTFLEHSKRLNRYHRVVPDGISGNCVWWSKDYEGWNPAKSFQPGENYFFSVWQSRCNPDIDEIVERIRYDLAQTGVTSPV